jgi:trimeric autotransporter adhesin
MKTLRQLLAVALVVATTGSLAVAQTFTGGVRGAVKDANGVIPGVTVELINEGTGAPREAVSNEAGEYSFGAVQPGTYTVRASLTGFRTFETKGVRIATQQFVTLDIALEVGQLQETITVTGAAPLIDTSNASTGSVIDSQQLEILPSGGRSAFLFAVTVPTVIASGDPQFNRQQDQTNASLLSLGGGARRANNYLLDGVPITDLRNRSTANPTLEALEGVNVQVHQYDAETGRTGGGTFNVATKSGTNDWHGSGFYQTRPNWGTSNNFYSRLQNVAKPELYFHTGAGGFGGPIVRNRTFFWAASEGYGSNTTRNAGNRVPTAREKAGDFSQSFNAQGQLVVIYDPLSGDANGNGRTPFPNNVIPPGRLNPVTSKMLSYLPNPTTDRSDGSNNFASIAEIEDRAVMYTGKVDHRWSDAFSSQGFYLYNLTNEPCANNLIKQGEPNAFAERNDYILKRRVHVAAVNNTWLPGNNTVATFRYGWTRFKDQNTLSVEYDPAQLGFDQSFLNVLQVKKFPRATMTDYASIGAIDPNRLVWYSQGANAAVSKLIGRHTFKVGADWRTIGVDTQSFAGGAGNFAFDRFFTSASPTTLNGGNAIASMLLGFPSGDPSNLSTVTVSSPFNAKVHYFGGYAQDDWRVGPKLTINYGVRLEHETGLTEKNDGFTVGFDRTLNPGGQLGSLVVNGAPVRGGLIYAGQNGANRYQGDPVTLKVSPRVGVVYSFNPKTVVRAGYGIYWAPWNYQAVGANNYGNIGFTQVTTLPQNQFRPTTNMVNPFPNGVLTPFGNTRGALTGVGQQVEFIDQNKRAPQIHQYSVDLSREIPGNIALGFEYVGATGRDLGLGGANDGIVNINQVNSQYLNLGTQLLDQVANPFFGLPAGQGFNVTSATVQRRQLLRPFPQFGDILMRQNTSGENQYHAAVFKIEKRVTNGWGGRINYTYSRLEDNQFAETNFFSSASAEMQNVDINADDYGAAAEYARGLLDVPHKLVITPIVELPFGEGKRWATTGLAKHILGGWTISSIIALESGFPIQVRDLNNNLNLFNRMQRSTLTGADPLTSGDRTDRVSGSGPNPQAWLNAAGFADTPAYTLGTISRTLPDVRTPHRNNWDFVVSKDVRFKGNVRGELKFEVLNLTDTVKTAGPNAVVGNTVFGRIDTQSGFMRMVQMMFRLSF